MQILIRIMRAYAHNSLQSYKNLRKEAILIWSTNSTSSPNTSFPASFIDKIPHIFETQDKLSFPPADWLNFAVLLTMIRLSRLPVRFLPAMLCTLAF